MLGQAELSIGPRAGQPNNRRSDLPDVYRLTVDGSQLIAASETANFMAFFRQLPTTNNIAYSFAFDGARASRRIPSAVRRQASRQDGYMSPIAPTAASAVEPRPTIGGGNSDAVLGQMNAQVGTANAGGLGQGSLNLPEGSPSSDGASCW